MNYEYGKSDSYKNGDPKFHGTRPSSSELKNGRVIQSTHIAGLIPVGDSLYVTWRILATGKEYEDRVNLKSLLPWGMENKTIHFLVKDTQLIVYLIEGITSKELHAKNAPDCQLKAYDMFKCTRIYPDHWQNF